jgi:hypothetical protein
VGRIFLIPGEAEAVLAQVAPNPTLSCLIPGGTKKIKLGSGGEVEVKLPPIFMVQQTQVTEGTQGPENTLWGSAEFFLYRVDPDNMAKGKINACALGFSNIHPDGRICWGNNPKPHDPKRAMAMFFDAPFTTELAHGIEDLEVQPQTEDDPIPKVTEMLAGLAAGGPVPLDKLEELRNSISAIGDGKDGVEAPLVIEHTILLLEGPLYSALQEFVAWDEANWMIASEERNRLYIAWSLLNEIYRSMQSLAQKIDAAQVTAADDRSKLEEVVKCECRACVVLAKKIAEEADALKKLERFALEYNALYQKAKKLRLKPVKTKIGEFLGTWTKTRHDFKLVHFLKTASDRGVLKDMSKSIMGRVFYGSRGKFDALFMSTSVPDISNVPKEDRLSFGKDQECVVGFATRMAPWRYRVQIGKKEYGLVSDDYGIALLVAEVPK